ncbi:MAG: protein-tyrosine phosphatase family protein [Candidatus Kariarchaeaceae archaeon]|jgi:protein-tyrosine phosphatase
MSKEWIKEGILAVGPSLKYLSTDQIDTFDIPIIINLEEEVRYVVPDNVELIHLPIKDYSVPDSDTVTKFLIAVQHHYERGQAVYVHCTAGCGRSGTMVAIWLASLMEWDDFDSLLGHLRELRPCAIETDEQMTFVQQYFENFSS